MAPRESTGTFPDQFLAYDYDASVPLGLPPPHDPLPLGPTAVQNMMDTTEEDATPAQDPLNHVGTSATSASDSLRNNANNASQVDPLSIDPTAHATSPWEDHNHHHQAAAATSTTTFPINDK